MTKQWAHYYTECIKCHTTDKPHKGGGLCTTCYYRQYQRPNPPKRRTNRRTHAQGYDEGYEIGLTAGRDQVANAVTACLEEHGVTCYIHTDALYLKLPTGTLTADLREYAT